MKRDFLKLRDLSPREHRALFDRTHELKARRKKRVVESTLAGRTLVLLFEKASTRTRLSFEAAMFQLGGHCIDLPVSASQVNRGEPITDTAKVMSGYADAVVMRTFADERLEAFANAAWVPVINGLSDGGHPVQLLADLFTIEERLGSVKGKRIAYVGDASSNMGRSFVEASRLFEFELVVGAPEGYRPPASDLHWAGSWSRLESEPNKAVAGADVVVTDVWTSMGQEAETAARLKAFAGFCVDDAVMSHARPGAVFLHCLPAHRGEEVSASVIDGAQSAVWQEAENRMHVQKALLEALLLG